MTRREAMLHLRLLQYMVINDPSVRTEQNSPALDLMNEAMEIALEDIAHMDNLSHMVVNLKEDML